MLNCKEASELMSRGMDANLPFARRLSLRLHLLMCDGCSNFLRQIQFLHQAAQRWHLHDYDAIPRLSEAARQRIAKTLHEVHPEYRPHGGGESNTDANPRQ